MITQSDVFVLHGKNNVLREKRRKCDRCLGFGEYFIENYMEKEETEFQGE